jgi:hypothetical protein
MKLLLTLVLLAFIGSVWFAYQANQPRDTAAPSHQPVISRHDILNATDFVAGIKAAVKDDEPKKITLWFNKAIELAHQAGLAEEDMAYLNSELARKVAIFQAKRSLFNDEIEQAYYQIHDVVEIKSRYPEAKDLFPKIDALIQQRNQLIETLAKQLATDPDNISSQEWQQAKDLWIQRTKSFPTLNKDPS